MDFLFGSLVLTGCGTVFSLVAVSIWSLISLCRIQLTVSSFLQLLLLLPPAKSLSGGGVRSNSWFYLCFCWRCGLPFLAAGLCSVVGFSVFRFQLLLFAIAVTATGQPFVLAT
ncbi:hypothetical protein Ancab_028193 [Ancistrocladus abbreviatus]